MKITSAIELEINAEYVFNRIYRDLVEESIIPDLLENPKVSWELNFNVFRIKFFVEEEN